MENSLIKLVKLLPKYPDVVTIIKDKIESDRTKDRKPEKNLIDIIRLVPKFPALVDLIRKMLDADPDLVERMEGDQTPLMAALADQNIALIKLLLEKGADPETYDEYGNSALMTVYKYVPDVAPEDISELIKLGVDPNMEDSHGHNLLMEVVRGDHQKKVEIVEIILNAGVDVNAQDKMGRTALMYSVQKENSDRKIFKMLMKAGARIYIIDSEGKDVFNHFRADFNMGPILDKMACFRYY